jgi:hypothetical protein
VKRSIASDIYDVNSIYGEEQRLAQASRRKHGTPLPLTESVTTCWPKLNSSGIKAESATPNMISLCRTFWTKPHQQGIAKQEQGDYA